MPELFLTCRRVRAEVLPTYYIYAGFSAITKPWDFDAFTAWLRSLGTTNLTALTNNENMKAWTEGYQ
ncbi:hypothetical protein B0A49_03844 [Cryomyces minteri]|uniref:Uncharacterized protein n=1 Tax=Cryomyces minteri TaxID=331657 RepID=A0A4U0X961_9PEZI|nr:hypothetical protein B0A49_03844 [Cryomyces minteri]